MIAKGLNAKAHLWPPIALAFGWVHHERRASGRKGGSPGMVLRGSVRLVAGLATRTREVTASELGAADREEWKRVRAELEERRERRVERSRFRRDPEEYLKALENKLIQSG